MRVAIVVVSYNTRELLRRCLDSIAATASAAKRAATPYTVADVLVIDNAGQDGSAQMVAEEFPQVRLVASLRNLGFTGGNNLALHLLGFSNVSPPAGAAGALATARQEAKQEARQGEPPVIPPDYVLLLNPDAELAPGALDALLAFMQATPQAGVCGPQLCYGDGSFQHGAFAYPDWRQVVLDIAPVWRVPGGHRLLHSTLNGRYRPRAWQNGASFRVDFVLGAAMCVRTAAIQAVGGLDDEFFMYCEEMDWTLRMAQRGWASYAVPAAQVIHHEAQSSRQVRWPAYTRLWRSRVRFFAKHTARYGPIQRAAIRTLLRLYWRLCRRAALQRFAQGRATGQEIGPELAAYTQLLAL